MSSADLAAYRLLLAEYYSLLDATPRDHGRVAEVARRMGRLVRTATDEERVIALQWPTYRERISR